MTMLLNTNESDEALIAAARRMAGGSRRRSERVCYYRCPQLTPDGAPHHQAGWIIWGDTQDGVQLANIQRGYIPLQQYGFIGAKRRDDDEDGPFELHGVWGPLLANPQALLELPKDQILTYHWYDANRLRRSLNGAIPATLKVKDGAVLWPQLAGAELRIFACSECTDYRSLEAVFLGRHLRNWHGYDRADIIAFGQQYGIDFAAELNREGQVIRHLAFEAAPDEDAADEPEPAGFSISVERTTRGRPRKEES